MTEVNRAQIDYWNRAGASRWVANQERIDRSFRPIDAAVLARAAAAPGEHVIDIGCGCGGSSLALAERVGPGGSVLGVDVSAPMLARARERALAASLPWARFSEADAATHRFEPDADLLYSRFGVMFFDDPERAFANLHGALRSSGRLCFVCWRSPAENPWFTVPVAAAERVLGPLPPMAPNAPSPFQLAAETRVHELLAGAGFRAVQVEAHDCEIELSTIGMDEALEYAVNAGPVARQLETADPAMRAPVRQEIERALTPYARGNTIALRAAVWIVSALK